MKDALSQACSLEAAGQWEQAVGVYEKLLDARLGVVERALTLKHLGNLHLRLGHLRRADEYLAWACELDAGNATLWHDRGVVEYHMADFDGAIRSFEKALNIDPDMLLAYFWLGNALYHLGQLDRAADAFRELVQRYPNFTIARFHLGVIYARQGRREPSREEFRRVLLKNPLDEAARFYVGR